MTSKPHKITHNPAKGIPLVLIACFFAAAMATAAKLIRPGIASTTISFVRFLVSLLLLSLALPWVQRKTPLKRALKVQDWRSTFVRIISATACLLTYFYAIQHIPLSTAVVLVFTSPLYIPIITWIWKKTPIPPMIWWSLGTGFIGVLLIVGPEFRSLHKGLIAGIISGILAAISYVATRMQVKTETPFRMNFYLFLLGSLIIFAIGAKTFIINFNSLTGYDWLLLVLVGVFGLSYQYILSLAVRTIRIRFAGAFLYFTIVFAFFGEWLFFGKAPTLLNYLGVLLVILGGFLMILLEPGEKT